MNVAIFGGTGFVGSYLVDELLANGHLPRLLTRAGSEVKISRPDDCATITGDISDLAAVRRVIDGVDAVIYNIGILKEQPEQGITFEALHFEGARVAMDLAKDAGVKRFLLMSANGVKADGTRYQRTKHQAERYLQASELDWTIFRPSVIFGDPRGQMEFATQLYRDLVASVFPAPMFHDGILPSGAGSLQLAPVFVKDVARIFVQSLSRQDSLGQTLCLGGPQSLSWKRILQTIGQATGRRVSGLPTPAWAVKALAVLLDGWDIMPITADQLTMLMEGNTCDSAAVYLAYGIEPTAFSSDNLRYLNSPTVPVSRANHTSPAASMSANRSVAQG